MKCTRFEPSASIACPHCAATIRYYHLGGMGGVCPHFYCDRCSNVFHRRADYDRIYGREATHELLEEITADLPACPCGGQFAPGTNPKCPACGGEIAHELPAVDRLHDPQAIVVESALFCRDSDD